MWNRDESNPTNSNEGQRDQRPNETKDAKVATLGASVLVKGGVTGSEDLVIDGRVEGRIELPENTLTIGPNANIRADIVANIVMVFGTVAGSVTARDRVHIRRGASVEGNLTCAHLSLQDGAVFSGSVAMGQRSQKPSVASVEQTTWHQAAGASDAGGAPARLMASDPSNR